jgi:pimeloyl-ACP methyl ester carboxylesterase
MSTFRLLPLALVFAASACSKDAPPAEPAAPVARTIMEAPDQYFTRDSARLRFREAGQGEPVVLLHGYTQRIEGMLPLADSLTGSHRVIVMDLRGFGESTKFGDADRYGRAFAVDVVALLDHLQIQRAHLVGHSMGASIAADLALAYPDRVASMTLIAGPFYPDSAAIASSLSPYVVELEQGRGFTKFLDWLVPALPDSLVAAIGKDLLATNDHGSLVAALKAMGGLDVPAGDKPDSTIEVVIAVGTNDPLLPQSRALKALWPHATLVEAEADHFDIISKGNVVEAIRAAIRHPD